MKAKSVLLKVVALTTLLSFSFTSTIAYSDIPTTAAFIVKTASYLKGRSTRNLNPQTVRSELRGQNLTTTSLNELNSSNFVYDSFIKAESRTKEIAKELFEATVTNQKQISAAEGVLTKLRNQAMALGMAGRFGRYLVNSILQPEDAIWILRPVFYFLRFISKPIIRWIAKRFIVADQSFDAVMPLLESRLRQGVAFTLDIVGDQAFSDEGADQHFNGILHQLEIFGSKRDEFRKMLPSVYSKTPPIHLSVKLSSIALGLTDKNKSTIKKRLRNILEAAKKADAFIRIDAEEYSTRQLMLDIYKEVIDENKDLAVMDSEGRLRMGLVVQVYFRDAQEAVLEDLQRWAANNHYRVPVRIVKGAYYDYEKKERSPVFEFKESSDANFEKTAEFVMSHASEFLPAFGTHNLRSIAKVIALTEQYQLSKEDVEIQMLYGMGEPMKQAIVARGFRFRDYVPYGNLISGLGYLSRRLVENTSQSSFLVKLLQGTMNLEDVQKKPEFAEDDMLDIETWRAFQDIKTSPDLLTIRQAISFLAKPNAPAAQVQKVTEMLANRGSDFYYYHQLKTLPTDLFPKLAALSLPASVAWMAVRGSNQFSLWHGALFFVAALGIIAMQFFVTPLVRKKMSDRWNERYERITNFLVRVHTNGETWNRYWLGPDDFEADKVVMKKTLMSLYYLSSFEIHFSIFVMIVFLPLLISVMVSTSSVLLPAIAVAWVLLIPGLRILQNFLMHYRATVSGIDERYDRELRYQEKVQRSELRTETGQEPVVQQIAITHASDEEMKIAAQEAKANSKGLYVLRLVPHTREAFDTLINDLAWQPIQSPEDIAQEIRQLFSSGQVLKISIKNNDSEIVIQLKNPRNGAREDSSREIHILPLSKEKRITGFSRSLQSFIANPSFWKEEQKLEPLLSYLKRDLFLLEQPLGIPDDSYLQILQELIGLPQDANWLSEEAYKAKLDEIKSKQAKDRAAALKSRLDAEAAKRNEDQKTKIADRQSTKLKKRMLATDIRALGQTADLAEAALLIQQSLMAEGKRELSVSFQSLEQIKKGDFTANELVLSVGKRDGANFDAVQVAAELMVAATLYPETAALGSRIIDSPFQIYRWAGFEVHDKDLPSDMVPTVVYVIVPSTPEQTLLLPPHISVPFSIKPEDRTQKEKDKLRYQYYVSYPNFDLEKAIEFVRNLPARNLPSDEILSASFPASGTRGYHVLNLKAVEQFIEKTSPVVQINGWRYQITPQKVQILDNTGKPIAISFDTGLREFLKYYIHTAIGVTVAQVRPIDAPLSDKLVSEIQSDLETPRSRDFTFRNEGVDIEIGRIRADLHFKSSMIILLSSTDKKPEITYSGSKLSKSGKNSADHQADLMARFAFADALQIIKGLDLPVLAIPETSHNVLSRLGELHARSELRATGNVIRLETFDPDKLAQRLRGKIELVVQLPELSRDGTIFKLKGETHVSQIVQAWADLGIRPLANIKEISSAIIHEIEKPDNRTKIVVNRKARPPTIRISFAKEVEFFGKKLKSIQLFLDSKKDHFPAHLVPDEGDRLEISGPNLDSLRHAIENEWLHVTEVTYGLPTAQSRDHLLVQLFGHTDYSSALKDEETLALYRQEVLSRVHAAQIKRSNESDRIEAERRSLLRPSEIEQLIHNLPFEEPFAAYGPWETPFVLLPEHTEPGRAMLETQSGRIIQFEFSLKDSDHHIISLAKQALNNLLEQERRIRNGKKLVRKKQAVWASVLGILASIFAALFYYLPVTRWAKRDLQYLLFENPTPQIPYESVDLSIGFNKLDQLALLVPPGNSEKMDKLAEEFRFILDQDLKHAETEEDRTLIQEFINLVNKSSRLAIGNEVELNGRPLLKPFEIVLMKSPQSASQPNSALPAIDYDYTAWLPQKFRMMNIRYVVNVAKFIHYPERTNNPRAAQLEKYRRIHHNNISLILQPDGSYQLDQDLNRKTLPNWKAFYDLTKKDSSAKALLDYYRDPKMKDWFQRYVVYTTQPHYEQFVALAEAVLKEAGSPGNFDNYIQSFSDETRREVVANELKNLRHVIRPDGSLDKRKIRLAALLQTHLNEINGNLVFPDPLNFAFLLSGYENAEFSELTRDFGFKTPEAEDRFDWLFDYSDPELKKFDDEHAALFQPKSELRSEGAAGTVGLAEDAGRELTLDKAVERQVRRAGINPALIRPGLRLDWQGEPRGKWRLSDLGEEWFVRSRERTNRRTLEGVQAMIDRGQEFIGNIYRVYFVGRAAFERNAPGIAHEISHDIFLSTLNWHERSQFLNLVQTAIVQAKREPAGERSEKLRKFSALDHRFINQPDLLLNDDLLRNPRFLINLSEAFARIGQHYLGFDLPSLRGVDYQDDIFLPYFKNLHGIGLFASRSELRSPPVASSTIRDGNRSDFRSELRSDDSDSEEVSFTTQELRQLGQTLLEIEQDLTGKLYHQVFRNESVIKGLNETDRKTIHDFFKYVRENSAKNKTNFPPFFYLNYHSYFKKTLATIISNTDEYQYVAVVNQFRLDMEEISGKMQQVEQLAKKYYHPEFLIALFDKYIELDFKWTKRETLHPDELVELAAAKYLMSLLRQQPHHFIGAAFKSMNDHIGSALATTLIISPAFEHPELGLIKINHKAGQVKITYMDGSGHPTRPANTSFKKSEAEAFEFLTLLKLFTTSIDADLRDVLQKGDFLLILKGKTIKFEVETEVDQKTGEEAMLIYLTDVPKTKPKVENEETPDDRSELRSSYAELNKQINERIDQIHRAADSDLLLEAQKTLVLSVEDKLGLIAHYLVDPRGASAVDADAERENFNRWIPALRSLGSPRAIALPEFDDWLVLPALPVTTKAELLVKQTEAIAKHSHRSSALLFGMIGPHLRYDHRFGLDDVDIDILAILIKGFLPHLKKLLVNPEAHRQEILEYGSALINGLLFVPNKTVVMQGPDNLKERGYPIAEYGFAAHQEILEEISDKLIEDPAHDFLKVARQVAALFPEVFQESKLPPFLSHAGESAGDQDLMQLLQFNKIYQRHITLWQYVVGQAAEYYEHIANKEERSVAKEEESTKRYEKELTRIYDYLIKGTDTGARSELRKSRFEDLSALTGLETHVDVMKSSVYKVASAIDANPQAFLTSDLGNYLSKTFGVSADHNRDLHLTRGVILMDTLTREAGAMTPLLVRYYKAQGYQVAVVSDGAVAGSLEADEGARVFQYPDQAANYLRSELRVGFIQALCLREDREIAIAMKNRGIIDGEKSAETIDGLSNIVQFTDNISRDFRNAHEAIIRA